MQPPDIIWDPVSHDVISGGGDKIALGIEKIDLPGSSIAPRPCATSSNSLSNHRKRSACIPDASLHRRDNVIKVEVGSAERPRPGPARYHREWHATTLLSHAYNRPILDAETYKVPFRVRDPFGADQVVAITSRERMANLEQALQQLDRRRSAGQLVNVIARFGRADARIGIVGLFHRALRSRLKR